VQRVLEQPDRALVKHEDGMRCFLDLLVRRLVKADSREVMKTSA
jgi:hypothetical protein